jgi:hypothetical protein
VGSKHGKFKGALKIIVTTRRACKAKSTARACLLTQILFKIASRRQIRSRVLSVQGGQLVYHSEPTFRPIFRPASDQHSEPAFGLESLFLCRNPNSSPQPKSGQVWFDRTKFGAVLEQALLVRLTSCMASHTSSDRILAEGVWWLSYVVCVVQPHMLKGITLFEHHYSLERKGTTW